MEELIPLKPKKVYSKSMQKSMKNLIPVTKRTKAEARLISIKGGKGNKNNPRSSIGQKLRFLKERGFNDKTQERLFELATNPDFTDLDLLNFVEDMRNEPGMDIETKIKLFNTIIATYRKIHGTKEHNSKHAVVMVHLTPEEMDVEVNRLLGRKTQ